MYTTGDGYANYWGNKIIQKFANEHKGWKKNAPDPDNGDYFAHLEEGGLENERLVSE